MFHLSDLDKPGPLEMEAKDYTVGPRELKDVKDAFAVRIDVFNYESTFTEGETIAINPDVKPTLK